MVNFREIEIDDAKKILDWRRSERVSKFMKTDLPNDLDAQKNWIENSFNKPNYYHWMIQNDEKDIGLLYFADWQREKKTTSWGCYIGEEEALGLGGLVCPYFHNFAFGILGVEKILAEVFYNNPTMIELHLKQGYQFDVRKDQVIKKNGKEILIIGMFLQRGVFQSSQFARFEQNFPTSKWLKMQY